MKDYSYSGIVNAIQGDKAKGKEIIKDLCREYIKQCNEIKKAKREIMEMEHEAECLSRGVKYAMQHLDMTTPLAVVLPDSLIVISDKDITEETNIL